MNKETVHPSERFEGTHVRVPLPIRDPDAFAHDATAGILQVLAENPERTFSNRELHRLTGKGLGNVNGAVSSLETLGVVAVERDGRGNHVRIDPANLVRSDDPVTTVPQSEYHAPVRAVRDRIVERIGRDAGVVLFGSVARGEADRASDVDVFVVVEDDRMSAQRTAHGIEDDLASERFDGDRYEAHVLVETVDAAVTHDRIREILTEGIALRETPALEAVKRAVIEDGA